MNDSTFRPSRPGSVAGRPLPHDSGALHVTGEAVYIDDMPEPAGTLQAYIYFADAVFAKIRRLDVSAVAAFPGVADVVVAKSVPGINDIGPIFADEPLLAEDLIEYFGQPLFAVAADSIETARLAAGRATVETEALSPVLSAREAAHQGQLVSPTKTMKSSPDTLEKIAAAPDQLFREYSLGGQDHFYLEGQIALACPGEAGEMTVYSSTQHPSELQHMVAKILNLPHRSVIVENRRMGGGFGGKETQAAGIACIAALLAVRTGRPVKLRLDRDDDMIITGKRHPFDAKVSAGFDANGRLLAMHSELYANAGRSADLTPAVCSRAMFHTDNAYSVPHLSVTGHCCKTNTVSHTAFRGFGGPQGMFFTEQMLDDIARHLGKDALDVRRLNYYGAATGLLTHYGQTIRDFVLHEMTDRLEASSDYRPRRQAVTRFNEAGGNIRKGLAFTPVKFGISFTVKSYNQAGALINIYPDGSVQLNHGATEMGQGVYTKVRQVAAEALGIDPSTIRCMATNTGKVPNTSATAASSGADLNGMAALDAAQTLRGRMAQEVAALWQVPVQTLDFAHGVIRSGDFQMSFGEAARLCISNRVSLSATGFYRTPDIHWDDQKAWGSPFYYFAYGAAVTEVAVDLLTGEYRLLQVDILHDCGNSLNEAVDRGQIEGGYIQGVGWLTTEELVWDNAGKLRTHAPSTYKIPTCRDIPPVFTVDFFRQPNPSETVYKSKAVGEPPFMLGLSAFFALKDAVSSVAPGAPVLLDAPATPERILMEVQRLASINASA